jgi:EAL domain-containing protein (putative c-di-GMP-specific phosphodiesterase class I)
MEFRATATSTMTRALRDANFDAEFRLVYQPIVDAETNDTVGLEALLRWTSASLGVVGPHEFISVAEQSGDICDIGEWVLNTTCSQIAAWDAHGWGQHLSVSLNVSAVQLENAGFVPGFLEIASSWGVDPGRLIIEVTESAVIANAKNTRQRLQELRTAGVRVAIDDFGSGYSNLSQLLEVPLDIIKVDRALLLSLGNLRVSSQQPDDAPCEVMRAIASIARVLGAPVVCEGVETDQQAASLRASGIEYLQGYLLGRPLPADEFGPASTATPTDTTTTATTLPAARLG